MRYTARGTDNTGSWWFETVDLSDIYRHAWPGDDTANTRIMFIGIASAAGKRASPVYLSGIRFPARAFSTSVDTCDKPARRLSGQR